jgi:DNA-binding NarL/FixJ family response regulator
MKTITVLLAEDHLMVREGLRALLAHEPDIAIVGEAGNGREAVAMAERLRPEVVVMDIAMPELNGMEATRQILQAHPETKVLILSAYNDDAYVSLVTAIGAAGYLIKQSAAQVLPAAIRKVLAGRTCFSPIIAKRMNHHHRRAYSRGDLRYDQKPQALTSREMEVLQLVAEGKANKETAQALGISIKTVEKHRQNLMEKLDIHDTAGLTRHAIATGVIESSVPATTLSDDHQSRIKNAIPQ